MTPSLSCCLQITFLILQSPICPDKGMGFPLGPEQGEESRQSIHVQQKKPRQKQAVG